MTTPPTSVPRRLFLLGAAAAGCAPLAALAAPGRIRAAAAARSSASLGPLINIPQTWNNCGPAAIAEVLAYWGMARTQGAVQAVLRVDGPSAGMTPYGVPAYARNVGLRCVIGVGGSPALVKALIAAGIPPIVHQLVSLADPVGHWRAIEAYDDRQGIFVSSDTYLGPDHAIGYGAFARMWALRGDCFIVLYPPARQATLTALFAATGWNRSSAHARDLAALRAGTLDASPAGTPAGAAMGYRALGMAWDAAQMGRIAAARAYLDQAARAGANPIQVRWVGAEIGRS